MKKLMIKIIVWLLWKYLDDFIDYNEKLADYDKLVCGGSYVKQINLRIDPKKVYFDPELSTNNYHE